MNKTKRWGWLFVSNFLGVFNDNLLKNAIIFVGILWARPSWMSESQLISIVSACLVIPYLFFSPTGGRLSAIYPKKRIFTIFKLLEIPVMLFAVLAFYLQWIFGAILAVLIMGILSSMYSPSKYGLIRDIGRDQDVAFGSGGFEMMAFLGILLGTVAASVISDHYSILFLSAFFLLVALFGYITVRKIQVVELPVDMTDEMKLDPVRFIVNTFRFSRQYKRVNSSVLGASSFWLIGSLIQMNLIIHSHNIYGASNSQTGLVMGVAALGIAAGTYFAGWLSGNDAQKSLVLVGIGGMTVLSGILTFVHVNWYVYIVLVFLTTFSGGLFQIPHLSVIQNTDLGRKAGDVFAYLNMITFILILVGAALFSLVTFYTNENSRAVFAVIALICVLIWIYFQSHSPDYRNSFKADVRSVFNKKKAD